MCRRTLKGKANLSAPSIAEAIEIVRRIDRMLGERASALGLRVETPAQLPREVPSGVGLFELVQECAVSATPRVVRISTAVSPSAMQTMATTP